MGEILYASGKQLEQLSIKGSDLKHTEKVGFNLGTRSQLQHLYGGKASVWWGK